MGFGSCLSALRRARLLLGVAAHTSETGVHHQTHGPIRLRELGIVARTASGDAAENVRMRDGLVASPLDNCGVNIPISLKLQPFSSNPEAHAQVLSDWGDSLEITFEEPAVIGVHSIKGLADLTQAAYGTKTKYLKRVPEMVPCKGAADQT